jgi:ABC-type molybdate transport system ATPase subunit
MYQVTGVPVTYRSHEKRDLRRYALPVVVQNAGQINIAVDSGQQVKAQEKGKAGGNSNL